MRRLALAFVACMLILPAGAWVLASLGAWPLDAMGTPPAWERALARMAVNASVARRAPRTPNPLRPSPDVLLAGVKVYRDACGATAGRVTPVSGGPRTSIRGARSSRAHHPRSRAGSFTGSPPAGGGAP